MSAAATAVGIGTAATVLGWYPISFYAFIIIY